MHLAPRAADPLGVPRRAAKTLARSIPYRALIVLFLALLWLPFLGMMGFPERNPQSSEARRPAPFPRISLDVEALNTFPSAFEAYFADRLGFHDADLPDLVQRLQRNPSERERECPGACCRGQQP